MTGNAKWIASHLSMAIFWISHSPSAAAEPVPYSVHHLPPTEAYAQSALRLSGLVTGKLGDRDLLARFRSAPSQEYRAVVFQRSSTGHYIARIPGTQIQDGELSYYLTIRSADAETPVFAEPDSPIRVKVQESRERRFRQLELDRIGGRQDSFRAALEFFHFGSTKVLENETVEAADRYLRGELELTHKPLTQPYSFSLGYGFIDGSTPRESMDLQSVNQVLRYGFGGVRMRLHRSAWATVQAILGFSENGFIAGGRGQLTLGPDWGANVKVGAETIKDMGSRAWVRLQWDTVQPFLMAAQVTRDGFPNADIDQGSNISYELIYPTSRYSLSAKLTYAGRGRREGGFGAGLAATVSF